MILIILCELFIAISLVLFLLWQRSEHRRDKHYCDDDCHEYGCSEFDLYIPDQRERTELGRMLESVYTEACESLKSPSLNAEIINLSLPISPAGYKIPFEIKTNDPAPRQITKIRPEIRSSRLQNLYRLQMTRFLRHRPLNYKFERKNKCQN